MKEFKCKYKNEDGRCSYSNIKCECQPDSGCSELEFQYVLWLPSSNKEDL